MAVCSVVSLILVLKETRPTFRLVADVGLEAGLEEGLAAVLVALLVAVVLLSGAFFALEAGVFEPGFFPVIS